MKTILVNSSHLPYILPLPPLLHADLLLSFFFASYHLVRTHWCVSPAAAASWEAPPVTPPQYPRAAP